MHYLASKTFKLKLKENISKLIYLFKFPQSSDSEDNIRTTGRFDDSSSSDEEILNTNSTKGNVRRLAMKPIGRKPTTFKMDVVDEWPLLLKFTFLFSNILFETAKTIALCRIKLFKSWAVYLWNFEYSIFQTIFELNFSFLSYVL